MDDHLKQRIKDFAAQISAMGLSPIQFWEHDQMPSSIQGEFDTLVEFYGKALSTSGGDPIFARYYVCNGLNEYFVEDDTVEKNYSNLSYRVLEKKGILFQTYPELKNRLDKYELVAVPAGVSLLEDEKPSGDLGNAQYGMTFKKHVLLLHRFFRRTFFKHNHFNVDLLGKLEDYRKKALGTLKVKLDEDMLALLGSYVDYFEKDYWYGRHFSIADLDDPNAVGFTVHSDGASGIPNDNRTEFFWYLENGGIKTLEIEEVWTGNQPLEQNYVKREGKVFCRFIHCRRNIKTGEFIHLDGSINAYSEDEYQTRLATRLGKDSKLGVHTKIFQIDGSIPFEDFQDIITYFFRGNKLVPEYLENTLAFQLVSV